MINGERLNEWFRGSMSFATAEGWLDIVDFVARYGRAAANARLADCGMQLCADCDGEPIPTAPGPYLDR